MTISSYYSNYTTCVRCEDLIAIEQAIINLLKNEGGNYLNRLPDSIEKTKAQKIWILGLFPGASGWTIIKTNPAELLCHRTLDNNRPRLSALAIKLKCDAFYLSVYGGTYGNDGILLETNATGDIYIAGSCNSDLTIRSFYEQLINGPDLINKFSLIDVPESFQTAIQINNDPLIVQQEQELQQLKASKNPNWKLLNKSREKAMKGYTQRIDEALASIIDSSGIWSYPDLAYAIYVNSNELKAAKGNLLYLQPPTNYKIPPAYTLTCEQWLEIYGEIPFED